MSAETIITIIVALYGAILSTILAIHEFRKGRPRIKVSASHGYLFDSLGKASEPVILIEAVNVGSGKVALTGAGWLNNDKSKQHFVSPYPPGVIPVDLEERKKCTVAYACRWFREQVSHDKVIGVYFQDQTGKKWIGRVSKKDKNMWLSSTRDGWRLG
jgi:hypothetical protein